MERRRFDKKAFLVHFLMDRMSTRLLSPEKRANWESLRGPATEYYEGNKAMLEAALESDTLDDLVPDFVSWARSRFPELTDYECPVYAFPISPKCPMRF